MLVAFIKKIDHYTQKTYLTFQTHVWSIKNLETLVSQITNLLYERNIGTLLNNTIPNSKEQINVILALSEREVEARIEPRIEPSIRKHQEKLAETYMDE